MKNHPEPIAVRRVMVGTDRSETAEQAVQWAAMFAERYGAELFAVQVIQPENPASTEFGAAERTRAAAASDELAVHVRQLAGERGHASVVLDCDPAMAIVRAAEQEAVDVLVVGNIGMAGRKEFLLGNVPNRISHNARCTVIIVNTLPSGERAPEPAGTFIRSAEPSPVERRLTARGAQIAGIMAKHGLKELFGRLNEQGATGMRISGVPPSPAQIEGEIGEEFEPWGKIAMQDGGSH